MNQLLLEYERIPPATWAYLASLLMIGLYFMFHRVSSVRNLDLAMLILLAPGLLLVYDGRKLQQKALAERAAVSAAASLESDGVSPSTETIAGVPSPAGSPVVLETVPGDTTAPSAIRSDAPPATSVEDASAAATPGSNASPDSDNDTIDAEADTETGSAETASVHPADATANRGKRLEFTGFLWLLSVNVVLLIRLLVDPIMVRRPLLEPNLSTGGLAFIGIALFVFLMANVITSTHEEQFRSGPRLGPGYAWLDMLPTIPTTPESGESAAKPPSPAPSNAYAITARILVIVAQLAVVIGMTATGYIHFGNMRTGVGVATLYLMMPYTAQMTGRVDHVLPAAFLIWAILCYRRPLLAGLFLGLASGVVYYPLFLLPLWISFYWPRGLMRFLAGFGVTIVALVLLLLVRSGEGFGAEVQRMFGLWFPASVGLRGVWGLGWNPVFRLPVLGLFIVVSGTFAMWPAQKNLGTLLSCSAAVMVAAQFWHGYGGGLYMAWYLPLLLLTVFRPNLEDRVALVVLDEGWLRRRRLRVAA